MPGPRPGKPGGRATPLPHRRRTQVLPQVFPDDSTASRERYDMTARRERDDNSDSTDAHDPIEKTDRNDPTDPTERNEPTEPIDKNEPFEAIESVECSDHTDQRDVEGPWLRMSPIMANARRRQGRAGRARPDIPHRGYYGYGISQRWASIPCLSKGDAR